MTILLLHGSSSPGTEDDGTEDGAVCSGDEVGMVLGIEG
jgi:hypothetical protein